MRKTRESNPRCFYTEHFSRVPQQTNICLSSLCCVGEIRTLIAMRRIYSPLISPTYHLHNLRKVRDSNPQDFRPTGFQDQLLVHHGHLPLLSVPKVGVEPTKVSDPKSNYYPNSLLTHFGDCTPTEIRTQTCTVFKTDASTIWATGAK